MPQETKNIIQLKESTSGPNFYPETHKAAIVGKETYSYIGEVVSPGGGGGGSTGGDKPLSVSPRQSVIVGRAIPRHPRKGKKYYFADGVIKVKGAKNYEGQDDPSYDWSEIKYYVPTGPKSYDLSSPSDTDLPCSTPNSTCHPSEYNQFRPVIVTIMEESPGNTVFDMSTMVRLSFPTSERFFSETESPYISIRSGKVIVNKEMTVSPLYWGTQISKSEIRENAFSRFDDGDWIIRRGYFADSQYIYPNGNYVGYVWASRWKSNSHWKTKNSIRRYWLHKDSKRKKLNTKKILLGCNYRSFGSAYLFPVVRGRISKKYYIAFLTKKCIGSIMSTDGDEGSIKRLYAPLFRRTKQPYDDRFM